MIALAVRDARLADLARSFPALLFALAVPRPGFAPEPVIAQVLAGAPLKRLARLAGLPMWSRRLMPEALAGYLEILPDGESVARRIANELPRSPKLAARWLAAVSFMARYGTPDGSVWIARELRRDPRAVKDAQLALIALHVWFSGEPRSYAGMLVDTPWQDAMSWHSAVVAATDWLERVTLHAHLGNRAVRETWLEPGTFEGLEFVPLRSAIDIDEEAEAMKHCVRTYADKVAHDHARLWSVRRDGARVATLEIGMGRHRSPLVGLWQLQGPGNGMVCREVWAAVMRWIGSHDLVALVPEPRQWGSIGPDRAAWLALWRPYWLAKRSIPPWLPLAPSSSVLHRL